MSSLQNRLFQHCSNYNNNINAIILLPDILSTNGEGEIKKKIKLVSCSDSQCLELLEENESTFNQAILEEKFEEYNQTPSIALLSMKKKIVGLKPRFRKLKSK